jgi:hypothetical protein
MLPERAANQYRHSGHCRFTIGGDALGWYTFGVIWIAIAQAALWEIE